MKQKGNLDSDTRMVVTRGERVGEGRLGKGGQRVKTHGNGRELDLGSERSVMTD